MKRMPSPPALFPTPLAHADPFTSKLAAGFRNGLKANPFVKDTVVLYLGAAQGGTALLMAGLMRSGIIFALDKSVDEIEGMLARLDRENNGGIIWPMLADASGPDAYAQRICSCDVLYQDLAQRDQAGIFLANARFLKKGGVGILCVKARSIDVAADPKTVFRRCEEELCAAGLEVKQRIDIDNYQKDHRMLLVTKC